MSSQMLHDKHKFWGLAATNMPSLACLVASHVWHHRPGLCKEDVRHQRHHVVRVLLSGRQHFDARPVSDDAEVGRKQLQLVEDARARARGDEPRVAGAEEPFCGPGSAGPISSDSGVTPNLNRSAQCCRLFL